MATHTDADVQAAVMAAGERQPCIHEARLALHGERIICDQCDIKAALDAVAPAIAARAKAEALSAPDVPEPPAMCKPNPEQWVRKFLLASPSARIAIAERVLNDADMAHECFVQAHHDHIALLEATRTP